MHPSIGTLSSGKFYAYISGYGNDPTYADSAEELEILLCGGTLSPATSPAKKLKSYKMYKVTSRLKFPTCYNTGYEIEVVASTKSEAISCARNIVKGLGHTRQDGGLIYVAAEISTD